MYVCTSTSPPPYHLYTYIQNLRVCIYGIIDGHGGSQVANYVATNLPSAILHAYVDGSAGNGKGKGEGKKKERSSSMRKAILQVSR